MYINDCGIPSSNYRGCGCKPGPAIVDNGCFLLLECGEPLLLECGKPFKLEKE